MNAQATSVVILGGGPGGYEAALVAAHLGARVTVVDRDGLGGAAVLTDCVPSKALIATADYLSELEVAGELGVHLEDAEGKEVTDAVAALGEVNARVMALARAQSQDIETRVREVGVEIIRGTGRLVSSSEVLVTTDTTQQSVSADVVLVATGATPRVMDSARPDGERILTWQQIYELEELPERLIVVGSGVTGAELAQAYLGLGAEVVLVSSRDRVLPGEDPDAATVIEEVFRKRGMEVLGRSRMAAVERTDDGVIVRLEDGREITGSHALLAVGSIPQTADLGLAEVGVDLTPSGHIVVDRVSRTSVRGVYAAGDCTGVLPLASVAAMQGRIAMSHALGDAVAPLNLRVVSANIFTDPEIATVGISQKEVDSGLGNVDANILPLSRNPRAKMLGITEGFVKLFSERGSGTVLGGVIVAPRASELIFPVTLAVAHRLNVDQVANTFTVYPSLSGSIAEAARRLHSTD
ncbi:MAG TPA: NAD(P)H-quinone dehydrogenase [Phycicoccus elongatus]|uniref:NAD(P)H-quinone dehydrogenase n=1 Tax=Phycicoccus TaxID=367298 RepID=UPI001DA8858B|nr:MULTISPECIES: NAD(P)H-quinone dehydrogenase [Phycicoccus]MBK8728414.1 NAD(P)H-quinone dehydrogenase [Tetrasphaera sp.]MCB1239191.1 NAD(P)H-quinone dehydrogenase [Tetrasphaera sp.]MCO5302304.1 NAD(P)H-quinone dehydrogenase [Phycicoccus sp.]HPF75681.1 NAD(P)H-quinone dehydrogenase [Phycicoccus elongatus]HPK13295.1 NAD(P)H-quinone dehydrogenase [Phycicoccus elongatus]